MEERREFRNKKSKHIERPVPGSGYETRLSESPEYEELEQPKEEPKVEPKSKGSEAAKG